METEATRQPDTTVVRPLATLRDSGILWLINAAALHPRGFALSLVIDDAGMITGWQLLGDGTEPWSFAPGPDIDERFAAVAATFAEAAAAARPAA